VILLDTHVWVWWVSGIESLSKKANRIIREALRKNAIYISSISVWEVAQLVERGRLELTMELNDWISRSESLPYIHFIPVDNTIAIKSVQLPGALHPDPADRIIIATALNHGFPLITRDDKIIRYRYVSTIW
jgi:PIN domain nuclease of toxin-antitoxin system